MCTIAYKMYACIDFFEYILATMNFEQYLKETYYHDYNSEAVRAYIAAHSTPEKPVEARLIELYYAIRDGFWYNPYRIILKPYALRASYLVGQESGYCIEKSNLFATCARALGIPARLGFGNVRNHLGTSKLEAFLGSNVLVFHGYAEVYVQGKWVKATPVFNKGLCDKLGVAPLEFDGTSDSVFQSYNAEGGQFMEYLHEYGTFEDLPLELFKSELKKHYPKLFEMELPKDEKLYFEY